MPTNRSLGLRHLGTQKHLNFPTAAPTSDEPTQAIAEFIDAVVEPEDVVFGGIETAVIAMPELVALPDFYETCGERIPYVGKHIDSSGGRWIDGVPAFLVEDRPVSRIQ